MLAPIVAAANTLLARPPRQALLSGTHNPFGRAAILFDPWKFLDVCETAEVLDAVSLLLGPDIVLWDSELYLDAASWDEARRSAGRYWPADPLAGAVVDVALANGRIFVADVRRADNTPPAVPGGAHYVIRYMPATSFYNRDPRFPPNRCAMEERPLVNYQNRPIWLVRGEDRAGSDFAAGFAPMAPGWAAQQTVHIMEA
ncbi:MAG: resolvase [Betaproteobacteria bacterium]|nr:resolvase [Betaproteobacteria bacterium]